jgi:hypothetical protein
MPTEFLKLNPFPGTRNARHPSSVTRHAFWIGLIIGCALTTLAFVLLSTIHPSTIH